MRAKRGKTAPPAPPPAKPTLPQLQELVKSQPDIFADDLLTRDEFVEALQSAAFCSAEDAEALFANVAAGRRCIHARDLAPDTARPGLRLHSVIGELSKVQDDMAKLETTNADVEHDLERVAMDAGEVDRARTALQTEITQRKRALAEATATAAGRDVRLQLLRTDHETAMRKFVTLQRELEDRKAEAERSQREHNEVHSAFTRSQQRVEELRWQHAELEDAVREGKRHLQRRAQQAYPPLVPLQTNDLEEATERVVELRHELATRQRELLRVRQRAQALGSELLVRSQAPAPRAMRTDHILPAAVHQKAALYW